MSLRGDAHPNSNSAWGHEIDVESKTEWGPTQLVDEEIVDPDRYETVDDGEVRLYLVAFKRGRWVQDGLAPPQLRIAGLFATADGSHALERVYSDPDAVPFAIARRVAETDDVPEASARRWARVIEEAHA